jgi:hypothetical protein
VFSRVGSVISLGCRWVVLGPLLFAVACTRPTVPSPGVPFTAVAHALEGTWSSSGTRQTLNLDLNHRASIFDLTGSVLLTGDRGLGVGFRAQAIGFTDSPHRDAGPVCLD